MRINFKDNSENTSINWEKWIIVFCIIFLTISFIYHYLYNRTKYLTIKNEERIIEEELQYLQNKKQNYDKLKKEIKEIKKIEFADNIKFNWSILLKELGYIVSQQINLVKFIIKEDSIEIEGKTFLNKSLIELNNNLNQSPFFKDCQITTESLNKFDEINFQIIGKIKGGYR
ncbi:MAG: PilN domain-containing protein [Halanaerobiaceae bacterium]